MGPPPLPPQASQPRDNNSRRGPEPDLPEKYAKLVRKYKELEEVSIHVSYLRERSVSRTVTDVDLVRHGNPRNTMKLSFSCKGLANAT